MRIGTMITYSGGFTEAVSGVVELERAGLDIIFMAEAYSGLDFVSDGRFVLGIGASGPQVIEGFHGVPYNAPLGRTRELVDICRQVWR